MDILLFNPVADQDGPAKSGESPKEIGDPSEQPSRDLGPGERICARISSRGGLGPIVAQECPAAAWRPRTDAARAFAAGALLVAMGVG